MRYLRSFITSILLAGSAWPLQSSSQQLQADGTLLNPDLTVCWESGRSFEACVDMRTQPRKGVVHLGYQEGVVEGMVVAISMAETGKTWCPDSRSSSELMYAIAKFLRANPNLVERETPMQLIRRSLAHVAPCQRTRR